MSLTYEICIDSVEGALAAEEAGAQRVELFAGLFEGGITPRLGMTPRVREAVGSIKVHVMILCWLVCSSAPAFSPYGDMCAKKLRG